MGVIYKVINGTGSYQEICEHCGEKIQDLHVSDMAVKKESEPRTIKIRDKNAQLFVLKKKKERLIESTASLLARDLIDEDELRASDIDAGKELKYGLRAEAMCSESIDDIRGITASFCYRVDNTKFLNKQVVIDGVTKTLSQSFHDAAEIKTNITGSKVGVDRKGRPVRLKSQKPVGIIDDDRYRRISEEKKYSEEMPDQNEWWTEVEEARKEDYIRQIQTCEAFQERYGVDAAKDLSVVGNFGNEDELREALSDSRCR